MNALDALNVARRAWERTQPQLFFELELDEPQGTPSPSLPPGGLGLVELTLNRSGAGPWSAMADSGRSSRALTAGSLSRPGTRRGGDRVPGPRNHITNMKGRVA